MAPAEADGNVDVDMLSKLMVEQISRHYSSSSRPAAQSRLQRQSSPLIHLKELNNAVKATLIAFHTKRGSRVVDLACGKGGDLSKWDKARISSYTGLDCSPGSLQQARSRYQAARFSFPARFLLADCFCSPLSGGLEGQIAPGTFDVASCQFALHYSWASERTARQALGNIAALLKVGGIFIGTIPDASAILRQLRHVQGLHLGNSCYRIHFPSKRVLNQQQLSRQPFGAEYRFHLLDGAVDCPEWLVPFASLEALANDFGLELLYKDNFHGFVQRQAHNPCFAHLMQRSQALARISDDEWDTAHLYMAFAFRKVGQSSAGQRKQQS
ncbi:hypothetical protein L7F22_002858 [Adiantum nelumboides]|nr:hypothetical protein [Adiantum nelumboides]MCO5549384.1 hypothetical protein [Adiantum nelumboides]MCO5549387.1 hypothetical protein [Adiantum nelumboides]